MWEAFVLVLLAIFAWLFRRKRDGLLALWSVFLVLYLTLLRRTPGEVDTFRLGILLGPDAALWAGCLLNLALFLPFGWTVCKWLTRHGICRARLKTTLAGACLSLFCEGVQHLTGRGMTDGNDVLFNTLGTAAGAVLLGCFLDRMHRVDSNFPKGGTEK